MKSHCCLTSAQFALAATILLLAESASATIPQRALQVAVGTHNACAILDDGTVKCWGMGTYGVLGFAGNSTNSYGDDESGASLPAIDLGTNRRALQVTVGRDFACAILDGGKVKCWGQNGNGQLGLPGGNDRGDNANEMGQSLPEVDLGATGIGPTGHTYTVRQISAGEYHVCVLLDEGLVKCWGDNDHGQLGRTGGNAGSAIHIGDGANEMGNNLAPVDLGTGQTALEIAVGGDTSCALLKDGKVKCWGYNFYGELGIGSNDNRGDDANEMAALTTVLLGSDRALHITNGGTHVCALLTNGNLKCWGKNSAGTDEAEGALGQGNETDRGGTGDTLAGTLSPINLGTGRRAVQVVAGFGATCAILDDGELKCWGANAYGQLGLGDSNYRDYPATLSPISLGTGRHAIGMALERTVCARLDNGDLKCWGHNDSGQLGQGTAPADLGNGTGEVPALTTFDSVSSNRSLARGLTVGYQHSCAIMSYGYMKCWGWNIYGQLGLGAHDDRGDATTPTEMADNLYEIALGTIGALGTTDLLVDSAVAGNSHTCARLTTGQTKCWGYSSGGAVGLDDNNPWVHGYDVNQMGDYLAPVVVGAENVASLAAGAYHTCARLTDGSAYCWGYNGNGQLGYGDTTTRGDTFGSMANLSNVSLGSTVVELAAGGAHTCALLADRTVKCWGYGGYGALGLGDWTSHNAPQSTAINLGSGRTAQQIVAGTYFTCALLDDGEVKCWGRNDQGQLGRGNTTSLNSVSSLTGIDIGNSGRAARLSAGDTHVCALMTTGQVVCWGGNGSGQLGLNDTNHRGDVSGEMGGTVTNVGTNRSAREVGAGGAHTCALLDDGRVKCWGDNNVGQLGQNSTADWGDATNVMANLVEIHLGDVY